jgi:hypothetical protein
MARQERSRKRQQLERLSMIGNLCPEEQAQMEPLVTAEALDFLAAQADAVEARIERRNRQLAEDSPDGSPAPEDEDELLQIYRQEKALLQELTQECQAQPFGRVLRRRLILARQRAFDLAEQGKSNSDAQNRQWQAQMAWDMLNHLIGEWQRWIQQDDEPAV